MKSLIWVVALLTSAFIVGCGGDTNAGTPPFGNGGGCDSAASSPSSSCTTAEAIDVIASSVQVGSGGDTVTISAVVKDSGNVGLAGVGIVFNANNGNLTQPTATTNASGVATATFSAGANRANRTATITATSGKAKGSIDVDIVGTALAYSGATTVPLGAAVTVSVKATDSKGAIVAGLPITVASSLGNGLSATSLTTDTQGNASVNYTATNAGTDALTFSGGGATVATSIQISSSQFVFVAPAPGAAIPVNSTQVVTVEYKIAGAPQGGKVIDFSTTSGVVTPTSATTDAAGQASVVVSALTAGPGTVQATVQGAAAQASLLVNFVSLTPARLVLQVSPTAIGPNAAGSTTQQSQLRATVTDQNGNPVANATVAFTRLADPSGGNLSQASAVTDSSGQATVQYISGAGTTADAGIQLRASILTNPAVFGDATMTVTQSALFIALGTGNTITNVDPQTYKKDWVVYVTDSNGVAVANKDLTIKVLPVEYRKGHLVFNSIWTYDLATLHTCANEDTDYTGVVTPAKDFDLSGNLQPGNVILVTTTQTPNAAASGIARTDSTGRATISLLYAESYYPWVKVRLTAQATVSGTESSTAQDFYVEALASDITTVTTTPAGLISPFGQNPCNVPN
jgi:hypothetical protein